jgi:hypothetical protein
MMVDAHAYEEDPNQSWKGYLYGLSHSDEAKSYRAKSIDFDGGIMTLSSHLVLDDASPNGYRCEWYIESFTYRKFTARGDKREWGGKRKT